MASRFCTRCGQPVPPTATSCPRCNAPLAAAGTPAPTTASTLPAAGTAAPARRVCANCSAAMRWIGHYSLRATGQPGMAGTPGDVAETLLPFSLYYCQTCGKFDFYYPGT